MTTMVFAGKSTFSPLPDQRLNTGGTGEKYRVKGRQFGVLNTDVIVDHHIIDFRSGFPEGIGPAPGLLCRSEPAALFRRV